MVLLIATISGGVAYDHPAFANNIQDGKMSEAELISNPSLDLPDYEPEQSAVTASSGITPTRIEIPALNLQAPVQHVGRTKNGQMGVPDNIQETGWYKHGFKPGEAGNAVIAGHVDGRNEPGAFFRLKHLKQGDKIIVRNQAGEKRTFVIESLKAYDPEKAPIENIFGYSETPGLNLITCTGDFNHKTGNYEERLVVYAVIDK